MVASNSIFTTGSLYLGTIQTYWNLNEHYYYLISTKSVIWQIEASCSPFQLLNILPFHNRVLRLKLIYYSLISNFSKYCCKTDTICFLFLFSEAFTTLEFDGNHFGILLRKIVKPREHNEIKSPIGKYSENINQSDIIMWCPENNCRAHF